MLRFPAFLVCCLGLAVAVGLSGCGSAEKTKTDPKTKTKTEQKTGEHGEHGEHASQEKIEKNLAMLSEADRAAAEKQKTCPVSNEALGSMGKPIKVTIKGQELFICCGGCKGDTEKKPDEVLAALAKLMPKK